MSTRPTFLACLAAVALTGCASMAPRYTAPAPPVPERFPATGEQGATAPTAMPWTTFYADPRLRQMQELACANNRDLRVAALTVDKAMATYRIQRSELLPQVNLSALGSKERVPASLSSTGRDYVAGSYQVGVGITSWEVDLFGRLRSLKQAALDQYLGTEQARVATLIALRASVADAYLALAADRESLRLAQDTLETQSSTLAMTERKVTVGAGSELDLHRAQVSVESARVDVASYTRLAALDRSTLDLLVGALVPEALLPADLGGVVPLREDMAAGLPATVLVNRPDILQAEHQLRAANANIGAARAAFFPTVSLTTAFGTADAHASGLFSAGSRAWSISPQAVLPIFDYGARKARLETSKVDRKIALAQYEKAIQAGYKEVGDALVQRDTLRQQRQAQEALVQATGASFRLVTARYQAGLDSSLAVLDAQRSDNSARQGLISLRRAELGNLVALYKTLGGGADPTPTPGS
jgi:outer membrane protein, multidrug efflux system